MGEVDLRQLGAWPTEGPAAATGNLRHGEAFVRLQQEMDKLDTLYASETVDWAQVETLACAILRDEGKDLSVAIWLACAGFKRRGLAGLDDGLQVLGDMLRLYWQHMTPPAQRLQARRNQLSWFIEWLEGSLRGEFQAQEPALCAALGGHWQQLAQLWASHDPQGPGFTAIARKFEQLPRISPAPEAHTQAPSAFEQPSPAEPLPTPAAPSSAAWPGALGDLQVALQRAGSQRERFVLRLAQCELLQQHEQGAVASALLDDLLLVLQAHDLERWEPALACSLLRLAARREDSQAPAWRARLVALDAHAAWSLNEP